MGAQTRAKILIVDDERVHRFMLRSLFAEWGWDAEEADDGTTAVAAVEQGPYDVILMDVRMPGIDGLEAARHLAAFEPRPAVVFCTAYDAHALSAFDAQAIDYLVKPVRPERLAAALERVRTFAAGREHAVSGPGQQRTHLCARIRGSLRLVPIEDVHYLQAEEKYVVVHHARGEDLIEESLKSLEAEFPTRFIRIHRNCLVARDEIVELQRAPDGQVHAVLRNVATPLEVSRRCLSQLRDTLRHL